MSTGTISIRDAIGRIFAKKVDGVGTVVDPIIEHVIVDNPSEAGGGQTNYSLETGGNIAAILAKLTSDPATQTTLAAILAKLVTAPALETGGNLAAILAKLTSDPATQTTLAAILAKLVTAPALETGGNLAAILAKLNASLAVTLATAPSPVASEVHIGETGGNVSAISVEITRENNATPYSIGDVISASAGSPALIEFPNATRVNGGTCYLMAFRIIMNVKSVTPILRAHWYNASPTGANIAGDNLQRKELYADTDKRLGWFDMPAMLTAPDTANSDCSRTIILPPPMLALKAAAGSRSIFLEVETLSAVTLTAQSKMTAVAKFDNN
jgi:hypothetical protein